MPQAAEAEALLRDYVGPLPDPPAFRQTALAEIALEEADVVSINTLEDGSRAGGDTATAAHSQL